MEATIVLAANSHGSAFALSFITEHPQPCAALIAKERRAAGPELRNVYRSNLATGLELRSPIIPAGTSTLLCIFCCMI